MSHDARAALDAYKQSYQPVLTHELDSLSPSDLFNEAILNRIVLWKVNRFASLPEPLLTRLNDLAGLTFGQHWEAKGILAELLSIRGVALPMASSILRFRNPQVFQVIDWRAYEMLHPGKLLEVYHVTKNNKPSESKIESQVGIYFEYLADLKRKWEDEFRNEVPFSEMDRVLYQLSKQRRRQMPRTGRR
ncbi:MAG TPA: hypothetical protein VI876_07635 [Dehalococcoidia bacterium]|nr:hypothetical protein [Dehalococcoidia bacterium]